MKNFLKKYFLVLLFLAGCATVSKTPLTNEQLKSNLKQHITTLASDKFEGRGTGTEGEKLAYEYIISRFKKLKLSPKGETGFLQPFTFIASAEAGKSTQLYINSKSYRMPDEFYPLSISGNGIATGFIVKVGHGIVAPDLKHDDYAGKTNLSKRIFVIETGTPDGNTPHGKFSAYDDMKQKAETAISKGAIGIIFICSDTALDVPSEKINPKTLPVKIPVVFAKGDAAAFLKNEIVTNCTVGVEIIRTERTGHNVIALLDNHAPTTIVIGAHYDHLGFGEEGSLHAGSKAIHNGADDNASGTGALIELATLIKQSNYTKSNYLFMAFSGEEMGLLGSNYFVKHPTIDLKTVSCMINMDMVGRLKPDEKTLIINGAGTSPRWKTLLDSCVVDGIKIKTSESGVGPSDHTSFYLQDIPSLHFFSGTHNDYHKPSDDEDKINYEGAVSITRIIMNVIARIHDSGKLPFSKTQDSNSDDAPRFKVTLGIIPDYAYSGEGVRADGVSEGKPAFKAGMQAGDVILQLGEFKTTDMMQYMKALGKFKKGETTKVKVKRGKETLELPITF
jgi:Iap family predicted aminopeptidase